MHIGRGPKQYTGPEPGLSHNRTDQPAELAFWWTRQRPSAARVAEHGWRLPSCTRTSTNGSTHGGLRSTRIELWSGQMFTPVRLYRNPEPDLAMSGPPRLKQFLEKQVQQLPSEVSLGPAMDVEVVTKARASEEG